jgi:iron complex outermembrane recepter protein
MRRALPLASALTLLAPAAWAAEPAQASPSQPANGAESWALPDLVITAQRREQNLQKTPVAVSALGGEQLAQQQIAQVENLGRAVPSLFIKQVTASPSALAIALRGAQDLTGGIVTSESPVGLYIDDVYQSRLSAANFSLADIERIEVLRGPQGTLYGRNSMTGAVKFVTRQPDGKTWLTAEGAVGSYKKEQVKITAGAPISDHWAGAFSAMYGSQGGWQKHSVTGARIGNSYSWGVHGALGLIDAGPWDFKLSATYETTGSDGQHFTPVDNGGKVLNGGGYGAYFSPIQGDGDNTRGSISAHVGYDFGAFKVKSITAYNTLDDDWTLDFTGGALLFNPTTPVAGFLRATNATSQQFTQEFQALGESDRLNWIVGAFYFQENAKQVLRDTFGPGIFGATAFALLPTSMWIDSKSYALYGQADYNLTDKLTVTGGLRYGKDDKHFDGVIQNGFAFPLTSSRVSRDQKANAATPKVSVQYQVSDDMMLYGVVSRGYRSGSFNGLMIANPTLFGAPYQPEYNWSYEAGAKTEFWDRRGKLNLAAYTQKISDLQESALNNGSNITENAAKATISGVELEFAVTPSRGLNLFANLAYTDAKYDELGANTSAAQAGATELPLISKWQGQLGAAWKVEPAAFDGWALTLAADYAFRSRWYSEATNGAIGLIDGNGQANTSLTLTSPDEHWSVGVEGKNVTNEKYYNSCAVFIAGVANWCQAVDPAKWTLRVRYKY